MGHNLSNRAKGSVVLGRSLAESLGWLGNLSAAVEVVAGVCEPIPFITDETDERRAGNLMGNVICAEQSSSATKYNEPREPTRVSSCVGLFTADKRTLGMERKEGLVPGRVCGIIRKGSHRIVREHQKERERERSGLKS